MGMLKRSETYTVNVGGVKIGSAHPIRVQSMTNTDTSDVNSTVDQILELYDAGSEIVRVTVNDEESAISIPAIKSKLLQFLVRNVNILLVKQLSNEKSI